MMTYVISGQRDAAVNICNRLRINPHAADQVVILASMQDAHKLRGRMWREHDRIITAHVIPHASVMDAIFDNFEMMTLRAGANTAEMPPIIDADSNEFEELAHLAYEGPTE